jgi:hypothetical protein
VNYFHTSSASTMDSLLGNSSSGEIPRRRQFSSWEINLSGGALLVDLLVVESLPPRYFALLVVSCLVVVPLGDTHGRVRRSTNSRLKAKYRVVVRAVLAL